MQFYAYPGRQNAYSVRSSVRTANAAAQTRERPNPKNGACGVQHSPPGSPSVNDTVAVNALPGNARRSPQRQNFGQRRRPPRSFTGGAITPDFCNEAPPVNAPSGSVLARSRRPGMENRFRDSDSVRTSQHAIPIPGLLARASAHQRRLFYEPAAGCQVLEQRGLAEKTSGGLHRWPRLGC